MDFEDYQAWILTVLGVEAWIEHQNSLKNTPEFENISFLPEDT